MRKDAALSAVLVAAALLLFLPGAARAGTYDVVSCNAPGASGENRAWTLETVQQRAASRAPDRAAFVTANGPTTVRGRRPA